MNRVVICFDLDGTLVNKTGTIHPADVALLSQSQSEIVFVLNTGRALPSLRKKLADFDLYPDAPLPFPVISQNGTVVYLAGGKLGAFFPFPQADLTSLYRLVEQYPQLSYVFTGLSETDLLNPSELGYRWVGGMDAKANVLQAPKLEGRYGKITALTGDPELLAEFDREVKRLPIESALCYTYSIEMTAPGRNKASGLQWLVGEMGVPDENIVVAGDSFNDLPMFSNGWRSFAPATADSEVLSLADHVIDVMDGGLLTPILQRIGVV